MQGEKIPQDKSAVGQPSPTFRFAAREQQDIAELVAYLRRIPSRHRHLLASLGFEFYIGLIHLETEAKSFADKVEAAAKNR